MNNIYVLTPFRNARHNLSRYFQQLFDLRIAIWNRGNGSGTNCADLNIDFHLIAIEGDSIDGTREELFRLAKETTLDLTYIDSTHGLMPWKSIEDPTRMKTMSNVMNAGLSQLTNMNIDDDDIVLWIMSDVEYDPKDVCRLVQLTCASDQKTIFAPSVVTSSNNFYDTWAFRDLEGNRFDSFSNSLINFRYGDGSLIEISSAGTCLVMSGRIAKTCRATDQEAVSFCADARNKGNKIYIDTTVELKHIDKERKHLLLVADVLCNNGWSRATHAMLPVLSEHFEIDIIGPNYKGFPHNLPYKVYPGRLSGNVLDSVTNLIWTQWQYGKGYDLVILQGDTWDVSEQVEVLINMKETIINDAMDVNFQLPTLIGWLAVDGKNQQVGYLDKLNHIITWTYFGKNELGILKNRDQISVVPLGVERKIFYPIHRGELDRTSILNSSVTIASDTFVFGFIGRNQSRKRIDLLLECFSRFCCHNDFALSSGKPNALLYLQSSPAPGGVDIQSLISYHNLQDRVIVNEKKFISDTELNKIYNSLDCFVTCTMSSGWELPVLESMSCGVPTIVPDWAGLGSGGWTVDRELEPGNVSILIPCSSTFLTAPMNGLGYVIGGVVDKAETIREMKEIYGDSVRSKIISNKGLVLAEKLTWDNSAKKFIDVVLRNS